MGKPRFSLAVPIPNGNMAYKNDGFGQNFGYPQGWRASVQWGIDYPTSNFLSAWTTTRRGAGSNYPFAPRFSSAARAFGVGCKQALATSTTRYLDSPATPAALAFGAEAQDQFGTTSDFWRVRLRFLFRGFNATPSSGNLWSVALIGYSNAAESVATTLASVTLQQTDWTGVWTLFSTASITLPSAVHHFRARIFAKGGPVAVGAFAWGSFTDFTLETLGPIDAAQNAGADETQSPTLAAEGNGGTYYELSKDYRWSGYRVTTQRFGKSSRLPSGERRRYDPSNGAQRRVFEIPVQYLTRLDYDKLRAVFDANKGLTMNAGSGFGAPFPVLFSPNNPDDTGYYVCDFDGEEFPLEPDAEFQGAQTADQLYRGMLRLVER